MRIITAAANLIKNEIRSIWYETNVYLSKVDIELDVKFLPPTLKLLMKVLVVHGLKQTLGLCILKAVKLNSVLPSLLFGIGLETDHAIGLKMLLTEISKLGYAICYDEVKWYKQSVLMDEDILDHIKDRFMQFVENNVDHNTDTLLWMVKVPSTGWTLLLAQSEIRMYQIKEWSEYQQF